MNTALSLAERQPIAVRAALTAAVVAVIHLLIALGFSIDESLEGAITGAIDAVGLLAVVLWSIRAVTPNAKVITRVTSEGSVVAGSAAEEPSGQPVQVAKSPMELLVPLASVKPHLLAGRSRNEDGRGDLATVGLVVIVVGLVLLALSLFNALAMVIWVPVVTIVIGLTIFVLSDRTRL